MKKPRPPIVAVMGHIDHGKSTLLDYIRKTNTTNKEKGGITQHLAAYEAKFKIANKEYSITFLDTPGHAAFSSIRERGSKVADIAILVVSAEDGVKPQTIEAISAIKKDDTPFIVAINKIDKPNANIDKTKQELAEHEVLLEGWGGQVPIVAISAKTGEGISELLETLILVAEVEDISFDPAAQAEGFVLESSRDPQKGISATLVVKNGILKKGEFVRAGGAITPVRNEDASAGSPISVSPWSEMPPVGEKFFSFNSKVEAEKEEIKESKEIDQSLPVEKNIKRLPIIIKADTVGSLEAVIGEIKKLDNDKISAKILSFGAGSIGEQDVKLAKTFRDLCILGFNVKIDPGANEIATRENIPVKIFHIIYELTEWMKAELENRSPKEEIDEISGRASILKIFSVNRSKQVVGGKVEEGAIESGVNVKIFRREAEVGLGNIKELQSKKTKTGKVEEGNEFGALLESKIELAPGDKLVCIKKVIR